MYPAYMWTQSYPHHTDPRTKDMKMDLSPPNPLYHQPWLYAANYCYPAPHEYHNCCNLGYYGSGPCGFRPPYPRYPPSPLHSHGFYPPFPGAYPGYSVPPPHYSVEQPRYEYDKNNHAPHHCCRCNHLEDEKKPRIEEEPKVDKKTSDSLVPFLLKDHSNYPIMWVPPGYMNNTEPNTKEEEDKDSQDPVSLKLLEPSKRVGNGELPKDQHDGDGGHLPFQIFWLPSKNDELGKDTKEKKHNLVAHKGLPEEKTIKNNEGSGSEADCETSSKNVVHKVIPVKQVDINEENNIPKGIHTKVRHDSVGKTDNESKEGKASPKTSKLPPVCLRIDPLPKNKKSSRSPSPPGDKERSRGSTIDNQKSLHEQTKLSEGLNKSIEEQGKGNVKTIKVTNDVNGPTVMNPKSSQQKTQLTKGLKKSMDEQTVENIKTVEVTNDATKVEKDGLPDHSGIVPKGEGNDSGNGMVQGQSGKGEPCKRIKKNLSEQEAALIIQSVYRGFEVRKSHPLIKLRQIGEVRKQVSDLRNHIKDLESSSSTIRIDDKQKLVIGETIMSLLLKLDTIQGLHPIVRDVRKSVAKELVGLQEKLDSLTSVISETQSDETASSTKQVMHSEDNANLEKSDQGQTQPGVCDNHEHKATESRYDNDAEACTPNPTGFQLELHKEESMRDYGIPEKLYHAPTESDSTNEMEGLDSVICENHKMKATESQDGGAEACNTNGERQLETHNDKFDQALTECENPDEMLPLDMDLFDDPEVEVATDSVENSGVEAPEGPGQLVEQNTRELLNNQLQVSVETEQPENNAVEGFLQAESDGASVVTIMSDACDENHHRVENAEPQNDGGSEVLDIILEPQAEEPETEQPVEQVKYDQAQPQSQRVESCESGDDDGKVQTDNGDFDMKLDLLSEDAEKVIEEEDLVLPAEAPKEDEVERSTDVLVLLEDHGRAPVTGSHGGEEKLMEENEKLRSAVEELMKAGNEQAEVIRELTGRLKDLEKKLSRKRKIKVNKCRFRDSNVKEEIRDCLV